MIGSATHAGAGRIHAVLESDSNDIEANRSLVLLEAQAQALPEILADAFAPELTPTQPHLCATWIVTGIGASEGPARLCAAALRASGVSARFVSTSHFLSAAPPAADGLIVVSQRLSPNGRIALAHTAAYRHTYLVTSVSQKQSGVESIVHGPAQEPHLFLRVQGPALAAATCLRLAAAIAGAHAGSTPIWWKDRVQIAPAVARALNAPTPTRHSELALVSLGADLDLLAAAQSKLVEGLFARQPPIFDALAFVHGPYQSTRLSPMTLLACASMDNAVRAEIWERLRQLPPHEVVEWASPLPGPLAYFSYDAFALALVLARLRQAPKNLFAWPGQHDDAPLYEIASPLEPKGTQRA
jgi:hypothetical protein